LTFLTDLAGETTVTSDKLMQKKSTTDPVEPGKFSNEHPEFGRQRDVEKIFGIKRGTLYNLLRDGKVRGVLLRVRGQKSGVRLFEMASIRAYITSEFQLQNNESSVAVVSLP
jgi:hypothetical protein